MTLLVLTQIHFPIKNIKHTIGCIPSLMKKVGVNATQKGIMVLGMDDIGDYSQFVSKELFVKN